MSLLTLTEYKTFPCYNATQTDAIITALLPEIEANFLEIRGKDFYRIEADITDTSAILTNIDNITGIHRGDYIFNSNVEGSVVDLDISGITGTITLSNSATSTLEDLDFVVYPSGAKRIAAYMLNYQIENYAGAGEESIGSHSMDYGNDLLHGYPRTIIGTVRRYI